MNTEQIKTKKKKEKQHERKVVIKEGELPKILRGGKEKSR